MTDKKVDKTKPHKKDYSETKYDLNANGMKKAMTILGGILFVSATSTGCVTMASDYDNILREYKKMLCVLMDENNNSMSDKTKSLQRQQELNKEFQEAMKKLSQDEKSNLLRSWANALVEVGEGKCD